MMPETVFWDTAAFVALGNRDDILHAAAVSANQMLAQQKARLLTTDAVLTEVANSFSKSAWRPMVQRLIGSLQQSVAIGMARVVHVDVRALEPVVRSVQEEALRP